MNVIRKGQPEAPQYTWSLTCLLCPPDVRYTMTSLLLMQDHLMERHYLHRDMLPELVRHDAEGQPLRSLQGLDREEYVWKYGQVPYYSARKQYLPPLPPLTETEQEFPPHYQSEYPFWKAYLWDCFCEIVEPDHVAKALQLKDAPEAVFFQLTTEHLSARHELPEQQNEQEAQDNSEEIWR